PCGYGNSVCAAEADIREAVISERACNRPQYASVPVVDGHPGTVTAKAVGRHDAAGNACSRSSRSARAHTLTRDRLAGPIEADRARSGLRRTVGLETEVVHRAPADGVRVRILGERFRGPL